jgi:serine phosphatase RsbU (regulator of sigma subunit)
VGGDLYDVFHAGQGWCVVIGDVCGKGAAAAALTALVRYTLRAESGRGLSPRRSLELLNEAIARQHSDSRFCTVLLARLEHRSPGIRMTFACGGHPPPLVRRRDGTVERAETSGTVLGVFPDPLVEDRTLELGVGDLVLLYTDGIIEARTEDGLFGEDRLARELRAAAGLGAEATAQRMIDAVIGRAGVRVRDDIAILALRVTA